MDQGLDIQLHLKDKDGRSVADLARMNGQEAAARWLDEHLESQMHHMTPEVTVKGRNRATRPDSITVQQRAHASQ